MALEDATAALGLDTKAVVVNAGLYLGFAPINGASLRGFVPPVVILSPFLS